MKIVGGYIATPGMHGCAGFSLDHFDGTLLLQPGDVRTDKCRRHVLDQENRSRDVGGQAGKEGADGGRTAGRDSDGDGPHLPSAGLRVARCRGGDAMGRGGLDRLRGRRRADFGNQFLGNGVQICGDRALWFGNEIEGPQLAGIRKSPPRPAGSAN